MFLVWIVGVLLIVIVAILMIPLSLRIDTERGIYQFNAGGVFLCRILGIPGDILLQFRLMGFTWSKSLMQALLTPRAEKKEQKKEKPKGKKRRGMKMSLRKIRAILRSFRIKQFDLDLDTDNYRLNAYLFPIFFFLNGRRGNWSVNYNGNVRFKLHVVNRPVRVLYALLR